MSTVNLPWHHVHRLTPRLPSSGQSDIQSRLQSWKDPGYTSGRHELLGHNQKEVDSSQIGGSESKVGMKIIEEGGREGGTEGANSKEEMKSEDHLLTIALWARILKSNGFGFKHPIDHLPD